MSENKKNEIDTEALLKKLIDSFAEDEAPKKEDAASQKVKDKEDAELEALLSGILHDAESKAGETPTEEVDLPWDEEDSEAFSSEQKEKKAVAESPEQQPAASETVVEEVEEAVAEEAEEAVVEEAEEEIVEEVLEEERFGVLPEEPADEYPENGETAFEEAEDEPVEDIVDELSDEPMDEPLDEAIEQDDGTPSLARVFMEDPEPSRTENDSDGDNVPMQSEEEITPTQEEHPGKEKGHFGSLDAKLMYIFENRDALRDMLDPEQMKKLENEIEGTAKGQGVKEEYTSPAQNLRFFKKFKSEYILLTVRAVLAAIAVVLVALWEIGGLFGFELLSCFGEGAVQFATNPTFAPLIAMQITMLLLAIGYKEVLAGFKAIGSGRTVPEVFVALTGAFAVIYEIGLVFCHSVNATFYNLPIAVLILFALLFERADLKRKLYAFKIISSKRPKLAIGHRKKSDSAPERAAFAGQVNGGTGIFKINKANFIAGYGRRTAKEPRYKDVIGVMTAVIVVAAIAFFLVGYFTAPQSNLLSGFTSAMLAVLLCLPLSAFVSYGLPFFKASERAYKMDSAIIGEYTLEEYSSADVISFNDVDIFPSKNVKVRALRLYKDSRIDHVLYGASSLFGRLGGPLAEVFAAATGETGYTEDVDILEIEKDGVEALVKGVNVCAGRSTFMRRRGLLGTVDPGDEELEMEGRVSVMYLAIKNEVCARMQIEYTPDPEYKDIMKSLYKAGMCIGIRTLDPNIDNRMMSGHADFLRYPIKILRMERAEEQKVEDEVESGVVSKSSVKDLLKTLASCRKVLQVIRANTIIKIVGMVCGIVAMVLATVAVVTGQMGGVYEINSLWVTLYQLAWVVPVLIISLIFA